MAVLGDGVFENRYVHFSSCRTLLGSDKKLEEIKQSTRAKMVSGYTKSVDQGLSAIHDIALMQQIIDKSQRATIIKNIEKLYSGLG